MAASTRADRLAGFGEVSAEEGGLAAALVSNDTGPVLVVGSLYLVGDLFVALGKSAADLAIFDEA
ncbi:MAG: hypothetical protein HQ461_02310, partial [Deltaproteobacteria bacterium]|nr:hypothetical protein [Deltaproteobacteria bacterium]